MCVFLVLNHKLNDSIFYRPQRSWGKVIFLHVSVILFTGWGTWSGGGLVGGCGPRGGAWSGGSALRAVWSQGDAWSGRVWSRGVPGLGGSGPGGGGIPACTEADPPGAVHAGRYGQQAGGTHPAGMHSCYILFDVKSEEVERTCGSRHLTSKCPPEPPQYIWGRLFRKLKIWNCCFWIRCRSWEDQLLPCGKKQIGHKIKQTMQFHWWLRASPITA